MVTVSALLCPFAKGIVDYLGLLGSHDGEELSLCGGVIETVETYEECRLVSPAGTATESPATLP